MCFSPLKPNFSLVLSLNVFSSLIHPSGRQISSWCCQGGRSQGFQGKRKGESAYDLRRLPSYMPAERGMAPFVFLYSGDVMPFIGILVLLHWLPLP